MGLNDRDYMRERTQSTGKQAGQVPFAAKMKFLLWRYFRKIRSFFPGFVRRS